MSDTNLKTFFEKEINFYDKYNTESDFVQILLLCLFIFGIITILYTRIFLQIDFEDWDIKKCNPRYIFYSGYIKRNPNRNSFHSTVDNFNECIVKFNNQKDNEFSKILEQNKLEHLERTNNIVNTHNKVSRERVLQFQNKVNEKNNEFKIQIENVKKSRNTNDLQNEINKLNDVMNDVKKYAHSYLTYAMMHFVFKYKISEEEGDSGTPLNGDETCIDITDETMCNSNVYCNYDTTATKCENIKKGEFYRQEALKINETIKKYFGNNKL